jgi:hypothetical protein
MAYKMTIRERCNWLNRKDIIVLLESAGIACYDNETDDVLRDALIVNVEDGTIPQDALDKYVGNELGLA